MEGPPEPGVAWTAATLVAGVLSLGALAARKWRVPEGRAADEPRGILWGIALLAIWLGLSVLSAAVAMSGEPARRYGTDPARWPLMLQLGLDGASKVAALAAVLLLRRAAGGEPRNGAPAPAGRAAFAGVLSGFAVLPVLLGVSLVQRQVYEALGRDFQGQRLVREATDGSVATLASVGLFAVLLAPLFEEFVFRRLLYGGLRSRLGAGLSALLSAALFAAWHVEVDAFPATFVLGLGLAALRERTGGLTAPIAMHACYNALQMAGILTARAGG